MTVKPQSDLEIAEGAYEQYLKTGDGCYIDNLRPDEMRAFMRHLGDSTRGLKKRPGPKPNAEGCQSRLYGRWGVHAKCFLAADHDGADPDRHSNGYRRWTTAEGLATQTRFRGREIADAD